MNSLSRVVPLAVFFASLAVAQQSTPPQAPPAELPDSPVAQSVPVKIEPTGPTAVLDTSMGRITCKLFQQEAPLAVANFIGLAEGTKDWTDPATKEKMHGRPLYNGTIFHRVIPEFMIQGGDPLGNGTGDAGYFFTDEFNPNLNFDVPGRLAMANSGPNTNGSQFFITEVPTEHLNQRHTIFGQCDDAGISVVKTITRVERDANDKPLQPVILQKVTIVKEGQPLPAAPPPAAPVSPAATPPAGSQAVPDGSPR
jgi:peptidyl-prolyl cis-trans isomerase A (cyclophilin A)